VQGAVLNRYREAAGGAAGNLLGRWLYTLLGNDHSAGDTVMFRCKFLWLRRVEITT